MDPASFDAIQPLLDQFAGVAEKELESPELRQLLSKSTDILGRGKIVSLSLTVNIHDEDRNRSLPLLTMSLSALGDNRPFRVWNDFAPQRYLIRDGLQVVPKDRCPVCWEVWDFKLQNPSCRNCRTTLGDECKVVIDTDKCPVCGEGKVIVAKPHCSICGYDVDPKKVVWG